VTRSDTTASVAQSRRAEIDETWLLKPAAVENNSSN